MALGAAALMIGASTAGLRINYTASAPRGLWIERSIDNPVLQRGMLVSICPPPQPVVHAIVERGLLPVGNCPDTQVAPLLKSIAAIPGDRIKLQHGSPAIINGVPLPNTSALPSMPAWADGEYLVQPGQIWIFSSYSKRSFDSRYFGPVDSNAVRGEATPLLTTGDN
ncbi:S26 family signal peptidase [Nitrosospira sp. NRS527]|uniref:S26 family signal peptidase n=1 Tax=Nitrosospira sp. NRS527 TaxID=155925 RepID=UPI001AFAFFCF|nr:S26 family signal peptidase [Nitrosospira sp. NRS527]BCT69509.1 hypothetical protein NNRS527_03134 [Nitrosospira sp. NRS527]